jgi:hypothetical protein
MTRFLIPLSLLLCLMQPPVRAAEPVPVAGTLRLVHLSEDLWQADYAFDEDVTSLELGPGVVEYRKQAWTVETPGLVLVESEGMESIRSDGTPFNRLSVRIRLYEPWAHDAYVPMDRHSDGGTAFYLGHLSGSVRQGESVRPLLLRHELQGREDEHVLLPEQANRGKGVYAYFGPQSPRDAGFVRLLLDPGTPAWVWEAMSETARKTAVVYATAFQRGMSDPPILLVGAATLDVDGASIKGGMLPGQLFFKLQGRNLLEGTPASRRMLEHLVAHELAHVWQNLVAQGGIGGNVANAWVHEGGAEALALEALARSGIWGADQVAAAGDLLLQECRESMERRTADPSIRPDWRENYTCGYKRFEESGMDILLFWKSLQLRSEASGEEYSPAMFDSVLTELRTAVSMD